MSITITVTAEDIANGDTDDESKHPIALAMKRAIPEADHIAVDDDEAACDIDDVAHFGRLPHVACQFIDDMDNGRPVQPIAFDVTLKPVAWGGK